MQIQTRAARPGEFPLLRSLMADAFHSGDEPDRFDYLLAHDEHLHTGNVRVALDGERPAAVAVLHRRPVRVRTGWVSGAVVTLVACDPALQRRGWGSAVMRDALAHLTAEGVAVAILSGDPAYYPRFGFVPFLPAMETVLPVGGAHEAGFGPAGHALRPAEARDLPRVAALYASTYSHYPCAMGRDPSPWLWGVRGSGQNALLILPDGAGYAFVRYADSETSLSVLEAAAADAQAARRLLDGLRDEAVSHGKAMLTLYQPPDHILSRLAMVAQAPAPAQTRIRAAVGGMAYVCHWDPLLPPGYGVSGDGLSLNGRLMVAADRPALVQLLLGYRSGADLPLMDGVAVVGDPDRLAADFPTTYPRWTLHPFWWGE